MKVIAFDVKVVLDVVKVTIDVVKVTLDDTIIELSEDHMLSNKTEKDRIVNSGGFVFRVPHQDPDAILRVNGSLAMSRAIGDHNFRKYGVIPDPDVMKIERRPEDDFIIVATDGLWSKVSTEFAVRIVRRCIMRSISRELAIGTVAPKVLNQLAKKLGSRDNITIIVVDLKRH